MRMIFFLLIGLFIQMQISFCQDSTLLLVNQFNKTKHKEFKKYSYLHFDMKVPLPDSLYEVYSRAIYGELIFVDSTHVIINVSNDDMEVYSFSEKLRVESKKSIDYRTDSYESFAKMNINFKEIKSIAFQSNAANSLSGVSAGVCLLSAISIVVAPIISINYNNWNFNSKRYYGYSGYGLLGLTIGTVFFKIFEREKIYYIDSDTGLKAKNKWIVMRKLNFHP